MTRTQRIACAIAACSAALLIGLGCARSDFGSGAARSRAAALDEGRRVYNFRCYYCHGYSGDARTLAASLLDPPPRDFRSTAIDALPRSAMLAAVRNGRAGTGMAAFAGTLSGREIEHVVDFVRDEFMLGKRPNTRYHTARNGWPAHERYAAAYPFATGELALDTGWDALTAEQAQGKRLYLSACVSCHDRARVTQAGDAWSVRGVSFPEGNYDDDRYPESCLACHDRAGLSAVPAPVMARHRQIETDAADPYELHQRAPRMTNLSAIEALGARLFADNCAHCHAADGTGRNWRGSFLDPHPPDFTRADVAHRLTRARVAMSVRDGAAGTSMPAWRAVLNPSQIDAVSAYVARVWGSDRVEAPERR